MAGNKLDKHVATALKETERWLRKQKPWPKGNLRSASGSAVSHRGPAILSEGDLIMQFARHLNDAGVSWKDIHVGVAPGQWLVNPKKMGVRPQAVDLGVVDRARLAELTAPFSPGKKNGFLFDAVFEFKLAGNAWDRKLKSGQQAKPPVSVKRAIENDTKKVRTWVDGMLARSGHVVVAEEADHGWDRGDGKPVDGLSVHYLRAF